MLLIWKPFLVLLFELLVFLNIGQSSSGYVTMYRNQLRNLVLLDCKMR